MKTRAAEREEILKRMPVADLSHNLDFQRTVSEVDANTIGTDSIEITGREGSLGHGYLFHYDDGSRFLLVRTVHGLVATEVR